MTDITPDINADPAPAARSGRSGGGRANRQAARLRITRGIRAVSDPHPRPA